MSYKPQNKPLRRPLKIDMREIENRVVGTLTGRLTGSVPEAQELTPRFDRQPVSTTCVKMDLSEIERRVMTRYSDEIQERLDAYMAAVFGPRDKLP